MKRIVRRKTVELGGRRFKNHNTRKTVLKKLDDPNVPLALIMSATGNRNEQSLDDYVHSFTTKCSKQLSNTISDSEKEKDVFSSEVHPFEIRDVNSSFIPAT